MSPMPSVSRANGERIWTVGARCGFLLGAARLAAGRLACGRFEGLFLLLERVDGRDAERRDGEVFVAIAPQSDEFRWRCKHGTRPRTAGQPGRLQSTPKVRSFEQTRREGRGRPRPPAEEPRCTWS